MTASAAAATAAAAPSAAPASAAAGAPRDPRLDVFRGVAMVIILIAHITDNAWALWIPSRFGFSDATEIFVFCSGMASALAFGTIFVRRGWGLGTARIAQRVWQIYWIHIGLFLATLLAMLALDRTGVLARNEVAELNLQTFLDNAGAALPGLMTLTYVPNYFDVLPMYIAILAMLPLFMALARVTPWLAVAVSVALWGAVQVWDFNLPAAIAMEGERATLQWFFNPFAWQVLFMAGFALMAGWIPAPPVRRDLVWAAATVVLLTVPFAWWGIIDRVAWLQELRATWSPAFFKTNLGPLRLIHFAALAYLAWVAAGPGGVRLQVRGVQGAVAVVSRVGQQSLAVFVTSMLLARVLGALYHHWGMTPAAALAVNLAGIAAIVAVAYVSHWFKRQPWRRPRAPAPLPVAGRGPVLAAVAPAAPDR